jgi:hypothetical protein
MRIAYVCFRDPFHPDGVVKKINTQVARWRDAGHDARVFCLSPELAAGRISELDAEVFGFSSMRGRIAATLQLTRAVRRWSPDLLYLRYDFYLPPPRALVQRLTTAVEINTDDEAEWAIRSRKAALYLGPNRRVIFGGADGFVCVTHELARSPAVARVGRPTAVISNGYDVDATRPLPAPANERPRAVFIGHARLPWHGVDKIAWLARRLPDMDFDVIGPNDRELGGEIPANVTTYGFLGRAGYEPLLGKADVAFGTLALHRKSMTEASPLKVREYLLYGIPTILAYDDTDFRGPVPPYLLQLPNAEDNVQRHVAEIQAFVERSRGRRAPRPEIEGRVSATAKEAERLEFLQRLLHARAHHRQVG